MSSYHIVMDDEMRDPASDAVLEDSSLTQYLDLQMPQEEVIVHGTSGVFFVNNGQVHAQVEPNVAVTLATKADVEEIKRTFASEIASIKTAVHKLLKLQESNADQSQYYEYSKIESVEKLEELEQSLSDKEFADQFISGMSRHHSQLKMPSDFLKATLENLFSLEFLSKCSWTGRAESIDPDGKKNKKEKLKIEMQKYNNILKALHKMALTRDCGYGTDRVKKDLQNRMKNALTSLKGDEDESIGSANKRLRPNENKDTE